jgi:ligand-binding sensor domain-containing protein
MVTTLGKTTTAVAGFSILFVPPALGQPSQWASQESYDLQPTLQFELFGPDEGLPNTWVTSVVQDSYGFLWVGTQGGVGRYDGRRMRVWRADPEDPDAIGSSFVTAMAASPSGAIWIGTGDAGLYRYDSTTDRLRAFRAGTEQAGALAADLVSAILVDRQRRLWVGAGKTLHVFDETTKRFKRYRVGNENTVSYITTIVEGEDGSLWIGTDVGLYRIDAGTGEELERLEEGVFGSIIRAVLVDRYGSLWVGTDQGLVRRDASGQLSVVSSASTGGGRLTDDRITTLFEDAAGNLWVGTGSGVNRIGPDRGRIERFELDSTYRDETASYPRMVTALYQDTSGVMWIGTQVGARKLSPMRARFHRFVLSGMTGLGTSFVEDRDGSLWVGTWHHGLQHVDRASGKMTLFRALGSSESGDFVALTSWIRALALDERGTLWVSQDDVGLIRLDTRTGSHRIYSFGGDTDDARPVEIMGIVHAEGFVWLATWGRGLLRFDPAAEDFRTIPDLAGVDLPADYYYTVVRDRHDPGVLWLGAANGGLDRFDTRTQRVQHFAISPRRVADVASGLSDISVHYVYQADSGLWLATDGLGLVRLDPITGKTDVFSKRAGLPSAVVYAVFEDRKGRFWLPTDGAGIAVLDRRKRTTTVFGKPDGAAQIFNLGGLYQSPSGELFLSATLDGVLVFRPEEIDLDRFEPRLTLVSLKIHGQETPRERPIWTHPPPTVDLAFHQSAVSFEFAALTYAAPSRIRYRYMLEGLEDRWSETPLGFATYTNLEGGDYVFRVQATNREGIWNEKGVAMAVHVEDPPWRTWWAYILYGLALLGLIILFVRYQTRRVESARQAMRLANAERELEITAAVQTGFLPHKNRVLLPRFQLQGFYRAAHRASGDWWWYEDGEDEATLAVLVGDVTGHGAGSAMVTAAAATAYRLGRAHEVQVTERLPYLNRTVLEVGRGQYMMTMTSVLLDGKTGDFVFDSAAGQPLIIVDRGGSARFLSCRGSPLGTSRFEVGRLNGNLNPGDRMVLFTDGIPELFVSENRPLGIRRFAKMCEATIDLTLEDAVARVIDDVDEQRRGRPQEDDWTMAMVQYMG